MYDQKEINIFLRTAKPALPVTLNKWSKYNCSSQQTQIFRTNLKELNQKQFLKFKNGRQKIIKHTIMALIYLT